ncbi:MAG TPA: peptidoglycan editing factor PgeF [Noviherbaspirillum sp.]|nr:peptidoglycan editing factor PgeF [Noviherbaspirillum sp.]
MELIIPDWSALPMNVGALSTTRRGGVSLAPYDDGAGSGGLNLGVHVGDALDRVLCNRALLRRLLPGEPVWLNQVHGSRVLDAASAGDSPEADACIATQAGVICAIQTADCLPVLFCDTVGSIVGAAHAGWRGLAGGVLEDTLSCMRAAGAGEITAWMGPAIGPQCFEVGQDVFDAFAGRDPEAADAFKPLHGQDGKYLADIYSLARRTLRKSGVEKVFGGGRCTMTEKDLFYSYRRDKTTGRMASLIWLK